MQRMGVSVSPLSDVREVIFRTSTKEVVIENPEVTILHLGGQKIFQVTGERVIEREVVREVGRISISDEDVRLVAEQTGKSLEEARRALEETQGDLARAILLLQS